MKKKKILFVCYGNTCRSPMAEGIARKVLAGGFVVESAGTSPVYDGAQPEAIQVVLELFGEDISRHKTRHVRDVQLDGFDYIVALDSLVFEVLKKSYELPEEKLLWWEIIDPFGNGLEDYKNTAWIIHHYIDKIFLSPSEKKSN
jgi:protein-tyrosine-phosphatase